MKRRLTAYDDGGRYAVLRGAGDLLRQHRLPAMWSPIHRGHQVRLERLPDVLAAAQDAGYIVTIKPGVPE